MSILNKKMPIKGIGMANLGPPMQETPKDPGPPAPKWKSVPLGGAQKFMELYSDEDCLHDLLSGRPENDCDRYVVFCRQCGRKVSLTLAEYYGSST